MEGRQSQIYLQEIRGLRKVTQQNVFLETTPGTVYLAKQFDAKAIWQLREGINDVIENQMKFDFTSNLRGKEK